MIKKENNNENEFEIYIEIKTSHDRNYVSNKLFEITKEIANIVIQKIPLDFKINEKYMVDKELQDRIISIIIPKVLEYQGKRLTFLVKTVDGKINSVKINNIEELKFFTKEYNILFNDELLKESNGELVKIKKEECSFYNLDIILASRKFNNQVGYWALVSNDIKKIRNGKREVEIDHEYYYYLKQFYLIKLIESKK